MSVFVLSPLRLPPLSTKYRRRRRPPAPLLPYASALYRHTPASSFMTGSFLTSLVSNRSTSGQLISGTFTSSRSTSQPKPNPPLNPHLSSLADPTIPPHSASPTINIVFHVKHTPRTRHTHPAQPSASMLPHFAQLPPGAAPHSKRGPRTSSPSAQHPKHPTPSTQPQRRRRPHTQTPTSQPQHLSTYALSSFPALDAITWQN